MELFNVTNCINCIKLFHMLQYDVNKIIYNFVIGINCKFFLI